MFSRSQVIVWTNKHNDKQTDATEYITLPRYDTPVDKNNIFSNQTAKHTKD